METYTIETWIHGVLRVDATIIAAVGSRIYTGAIPPDGSTFPLILITLEGQPDDLMVVNAKRVWSDCRYIVRAIDQKESYSTVSSIADRIDTLLHRQSGTNVHACVREQVFEMTEVVDNVQYKHLGGIYRIYGS